MMRRVMRRQRQEKEMQETIRYAPSALVFACPLMSQLHHEKMSILLTLTSHITGLLFLATQLLHHPESHNYVRPVKINLPMSSWMR